MLGSAAFTTVTSSSSMKTAVQTTPSVHHLRSGSAMATDQQRGARRAAQIAQFGEPDLRRAVVVEQVREHLLGQPGAGGLAELGTHPAAEDHGLDVEQVDRAGRRGGDRGVRAVDDLGRDLVAVLEGARPDPGGQPVAAALLHQLEQDGLLAMVVAALGLGLHRAAAGVGLHAALATARAAPSALLDDHVADLAGATAAVPLAALEDQPTADAGAPEDAEHRGERPPGAELDLGVGARGDVVAEADLRGAEPVAQLLGEGDRPVEAVEVAGVVDR